MAYSKQAEMMLSWGILPRRQHQLDTPFWFTCDPHWCTSFVLLTDRGWVKEMDRERQRGCHFMHPIPVPFRPQNKRRHAYSNSESLRCSEPNPISLRRINSGRGNLSAAKIYLLETTLGFLSLAVCLFLLFFTLPSCCFCLPLCVLSCRFCASSARSIGANESRLYEGVSCFPSQEQAPLIWSNGYWLDHWFIEVVISALYQHPQRKCGRERVQKMKGRSKVCAVVSLRQRKIKTSEVSVSAFIIELFLLLWSCFCALTKYNLMK